MKALLVLLLAVGLFIGYRLHQQEVRQAVVEATSMQDDSVSRRELLKQERIKRQRTAMVVSRILEPVLLELAAPLNLDVPEDLVPRLEITKQRILDRKVHAEELRAPVYDSMAHLMDGMIMLAEERTKSLAVALQNAQRGSSNALATAPTSSAELRASAANGAFFNKTVFQKWENTVHRYRPYLNQRLQALRDAERAWNANVSKDAAFEYYDLPSFQPALVRVDAAPTATMLETSAPQSGSDSSRRYIWRRSIYDQYGYRY